MRSRWLALAAVAVAMIPGTVGASSFTVVVSLMQVSSGFTVEAHTRIGATCSGIGFFGGRGGETKFPSQHVGKTGIVTWNYPVSLTPFGIDAVVSCIWKGQQRNGEAVALPQPPSGSGIPVLGGPLSDWIDIYGMPSGGDPSINDGSGIAQWQPCGVDVPSVITVDFMNFRADTITYHWCDRTLAPSDEIMFGLAQRFFPSDSRPAGHLTNSLGYARLFTSKTLAPVLPSIDWQDCDGNQITPGIFSFAADQPDAAWFLGSGTCS